MSSNIFIQKICQICSKEFTARTTVTKYCSPKCGKNGYRLSKRTVLINKEQERNNIDIEESRLRHVKNKPILTITEAALYIGVGRPAIYRYINNGELESMRIGSRTFLSLNDILSLFNTKKPENVKPFSETAPIPNMYTLSKIMEKYKVNKTWVYAMVKKHKIPKRISEGKGLYSQKHIDKVFADKIPNPNINEWYSVSEIQDKYNMTRTAIYSFVSEKSIPKKKEGKKVYYSKCHFDKARGADIIIIDINYYTVEEAMAKYNLTKASIYACMRQHKIPRIKEGRYVKISRLHIDEIFK